MKKQIWAGLDANGEVRFFTLDQHQAAHVITREEWHTILSDSQAVPGEMLKVKLFLQKRQS